MPNKAHTAAQRAQSALKSLPSSIRVGAFDVRIIRWPVVEANAADRYGEFSATEQVIRISAELQSCHKVADSFMHELFHAIWWVTDLGREETEEHVVGHMSSTLVQVHRDNPWLARWIAENTK